jgi:hypothetical protein
MKGSGVRVPASALAGSHALGGSHEIKDSRFVDARLSRVAGARPGEPYRLGQGTVGLIVTVSPLRNVISTLPLKPPLGHVLGTVP